MALNMQDKHGLMDEILPEVQINLTSTGILVTSQRIAEPVIVPFDQVGKCPECKGTELEVDYVVTKQGVRIWCTRFKKQPRFVGFDCVYDLPGHTFIRIRNKARVFNVPHGVPDPKCIQPPTLVTMPIPPPPLPPKPEEKPMEVSFHLSPPPPPPPMPKEELMDTGTALTIGTEMGTQTEPQAPVAQADTKVVSDISVDAMPQDTEEEQKEWAGVQEFMDSIAAATTDLNFASAGIQQMQTSEEMKEEEKAINSITPQL